MKILKISKKDTVKKLEDVLDMMQEICEELKEKDIHTSAFSVSLEIMGIIDLAKKSNS